ncbi:16S rRNA (cytidine(1402)-2'-O)-methyltransferase [Solemya pervernicosa gill symbiont]|uniref:Ribosomal RNA small subunit methyltransferase I n=1 Tax=Solemya pervernicosa gill symbiont TaxID=642797 RepID=A0A1T2L9S8_9GAMM|nr:16S rRNA (cytidine(1402)-2'-O)-methyltransferase [Solemya pervernicosa gill symbiont]
MSIEYGRLYIVATPIGNLGDMTPRAVEVLKTVDRIAAEDTRHSGGLLKHFAITTPMFALHEHNERQRCGVLIDMLLGGESVALISDAGTPLISDPGYHLVREAHRQGISVVPVAGVSALITALSASGLATDRFCFEGFLPAKSAARRARLELLGDESRTITFYESPHRILDSLADMVAVLGAERPAVVARELTKRFETIKHATLGELLAWAEADSDQQRGEFVVAIEGAIKKESQGLDDEVLRIAQLLRDELPLKQAAALAAKISGEKKNAIYQHLLQAERDG